MKLVNRLFCIAAAAVALVMTACVESTEMSFEEAEHIALRAWMERNRPDLLDNFQPQGEYYVDLLDEGVADSMPVMYDDAWLWFSVTCRDLAGNVVLTRNSDLAQLQNSYTDYTHYSPFFLYCGANSTSLVEGTYMAIRNKLKIGDRDYSVRYGTKMRLYLPSSIGTKSQGMGGDGGYEGQFTLNANRPMIIDVQVWGHVTNPVAYEDQWVKSFAAANGGLAPEKPDDEDKAEKRRSYMRPQLRADKEDDDKEEEIVYDNQWHLAVDSIAALYINYLYTPKQSLNFDCLGRDTLIYEGQTEYNRGKIYGSRGLAQINKQIDEALIERFGEGLHPADAEPLDSVSTAKIWYVMRSLDGFVIKTNIDEVKKIVYENSEIGNEDSAREFITGDDGEANTSFLDAERYAIPQMKLGAWNCIISGSSNAYGAVGVTGATSSSSSSGSYYDFYNYYNYFNSYYGNGYYPDYYGGYYGYGYGGYGYDYYSNYMYGPYYGNYNYGYNTGDTTVTTTTVTEVQPYAPLLWQIFIEKAEEKDELDK